MTPFCTSMEKKRKQPMPRTESSEEEEEVEEEIEEEVEEEIEEEVEEEIEEEGDEEEEVEEEEEDKHAEKNQTTAAATDSDEEEHIDPSDRNAIQKLLEPFGKDELMDLLTEACLKNPKVLSSLNASAASDTSRRRLFIHGLSSDATTAALSAAFSPYGALEECYTVVDRANGRCRGYGFVTFCRRSAARRALADSSKRVAGRIVRCQLSSLGPPSSAGTAAPHATSRELFVSNVPAHATPDRLRKFFSQFGEVEEGPITGHLRGFASFLYKSPKGLRKALEEPLKVFDGSELICRHDLEGIKRKHSAAVQNQGGGVVALPVVQANDLALTYASQSLLSLNPLVGFTGQGFSPSAGLGQSVDAGLLSTGFVSASPAPVVARSIPSTSPASYIPAFGLGGSTAIPVGESATGVNSVSPSIISNYVSQAALKGVGAYNSSQLSSTGTSRSQVRPGSTGSGLIRHYMGR